jgi:hypothetical protein
MSSSLLAPDSSPGDDQPVSGTGVMVPQVGLSSVNNTFSIQRVRRTEGGMAENTSLATAVQSVEWVTVERTSGTSLRR